MSDGFLCLPQGAVGQFYRRQPNPRLIAGAHTFQDTKIDTALLDPDLLWDGTTWHLYYTSPHGTFDSPGVETLIRHATSTDLATWNLQDAPALRGGSEPTVVIDKSNYFAMLFKYFNGRITLVVSTDGSEFGGTAYTFTVSDPTLTLSDPELVRVGDTYHLWFVATNDTVHGIGHATSNDLISWTVDPIPTPSLLRTPSDPKSGGAQPTVIYDEQHCRWEMWFSNDLPGDNKGTVDGSTAGVWHATSTNATSWSVNYQQPRDFAWSSTETGEHLGMAIGADVAQKNGGRYMLYTGFDNQNVPPNSTLPTSGGTTSGVQTLNLATRDVTTL